MGEPRKTQFFVVVFVIIDSNDGVRSILLFRVNCMLAICDYLTRMKHDAMHFRQSTVVHRPTRLDHFHRSIKCENRGSESEGKKSVQMNFVRLKSPEIGL